MKHLLRPYGKSTRHLALAALAASFLAIAPSTLRSQALQIAPLFDEPYPLLAKASTAGYLGVDVVDVDADKAQALKLKEVRGAVITLIDHDAPAGQIGLKVNDVVLAINGQNVENADQLRRILREIPPGRNISLVISRDGNIRTMAAQLVDRKAMEHDIWSKIGVDVDGIAPPSPPPAMGILSGDTPISGGFHLSIFTSSLNVGALVEPLTSQMAEYFGVQGGLMVKQVARKSEAAAAGFKAFDVILKVGSESINTSADWDRALRSNQGKPVQVTILRNKKQQVLTLQVDSKRRGAVEQQKLFLPDGSPLFAGLDPEFAQALSAQAAAESEALRQQIDEMNFQLTSEQAGMLQRQADEMRRNMQNFQLDSKQMEQLEKQMDAFRKNFTSEQLKQLQKQMYEFRRQLEESQRQCRGNFV